MIQIAWILNLMIVITEWMTLSHIRNKVDILKYYTYLQNFLALITSLVFCIISISSLRYDNTILEFIKGLRYITSCGLLATMLIFIIVLKSGKKISITEDDFLSGLNPKTANIILHYLCPVLSCISFLVFERDIMLSNGIWTACAAIPSIIYWLIYWILTMTHSWIEPYDFSSTKKNIILDILTTMMIPMSFILISFVLWNMK